MRMGGMDASRFRETDRRRLTDQRKEAATTQWPPRVSSRLFLIFSKVEFVRLKLWSQACEGWLRTGLKAEQERKHGVKSGERQGKQRRTTPDRVLQRLFYESTITLIAAASHTGNFGILLVRTMKNGSELPLFFACYPWMFFRKKKTVKCSHRGLS